MNYLIEFWNTLQGLPVNVTQTPALCFGWLALAAPTAIGALMGHSKNKRAQQVEASDRKLAAETQRYSPWTGMQAQPIRNAGSAFGDIGGGAMAGFGVGQSAYNTMGFGKQENPNAWMEALKKKSGPEALNAQSQENLQKYLYEG